MCHNFDLRAAQTPTSIKGRHKSNENVIRGEKYCPQFLKMYFYICNFFNKVQ